MQTRMIRRRADLIGEVLPPADIVPWEEAEILAARQPAPLISINLPLAGAGDDQALMTWEKRTAARSVTVEADVAVPVVQAVMTAIAVGILAGCAAWAFGWPARVVALAFGVAGALAWFWRLRIADSLLWSVETLTGHDMNRDGKIGQPAAAFALVNPAQARTEAAQAVKTTETEAAKAELLAFVHRCYTVGCGERSHGVAATGPDRAAYVRCRDVLMALGIARWKREGRPRAGWIMAVSHQRALDLIGRHVL